jgi:hypothetical protein
MQAGERGGDMTLKAQWYHDRLAKKVARAFVATRSPRLLSMGPTTREQRRCRSASSRTKMRMPILLSDGYVKPSPA